MPALSPVYQPREPTDSPLWKVLHQHYAAFKSGYDEYCEKQYGFFRPVVDEVGEEYLRCGDLHEGFARVRRWPRCIANTIFSAMDISAAEPAKGF